MTSTPVTILGLGLMGTALAEAFLATGHRPTVWNRTPAKADGLVERGAERAVTVQDAVGAGPITVACVSTYKVLREILEPATDTLRERTLVNLTSGSPEEAREMATWASQRGIGYLDGAIMAIPQMIATPDALLLYSGSQTAFETHQAALASLGAGQYLGADAGLASVHDSALLGMMYATQYGALHAMALVGAEGVDATRFLPLAQGWYNAVGSFLPDLAREVREGDYSTAVATLDTDRAALDHIIAASREAGLATNVFASIQALADHAISQGHGAGSFSAVVDTIRDSERLS